MITIYLFYSYSPAIGWQSVPE